MPTTIISLLIIVFALFPGIPAYKLYKSINGFDWKTPEWEKVVCIIGFSMAGIMVYILLGSLINLPFPIYLIPDTFTSNGLSQQNIITIAFALLGQLVASLLVSFLLAKAIILLSKITSISGLPSAWDNFMKFEIPSHWVIITLINHETYLGYIGFYDSAVCSEERDIVLLEPSRYDIEKDDYQALNYKSMFIPAKLISSLGAVSDRNQDTRLSQIGDFLFSEGKNEQTK